MNRNSRSRSGGSGQGTGGGCGFRPEATGQGAEDTAAGSPADTLRQSAAWCFRRDGRGQAEKQTMG